MYQKKVPKSQEPDKSLYTIHHCHSTPIPIEWNCRKDYYRVMSIDPGKKNFCFRIELRNLETGNITTEVYEKIDLIGSQPSDRVTVDYINRNAITILDRYIDLILNCHIIIIERQMQINYKMVRFSQHVITYLMIKVMNNSLKTVILEIDSKLKTKQLNAPKKLGADGTKTWAIEKAYLLLKQRNDLLSINIMDKAQKSKKDDLADTVIQIEAVFSLFNLLDKSSQIYPNLHDSNNYRISFGSDQLYNPKHSIGLTLNNINHKIDNTPKENSSNSSLQILNTHKFNINLPQHTTSMNYNIDHTVLQLQEGHKFKINFENIK